MEDKDGPPTPAILYAAKSTEDTHGSIPTQLSDGRELADRHGWQVEGEYADTAKSAWKGNRGEQLLAAMAHCERLVAEHGRCTLIVQHSDRLARGDGKAAAHLVEYELWALKTGVTIASVQDPQTFGDLLYAVVTGQRNHEDSARKSAATKAGKRRQFQRGQSLGGPVRDGYVRLPRVEGQPPRYELCPVRGPILRRMFELADGGMPDATIARTLNAEGLRTKAGKPWTRRRVQDTLLSPWYCGRVAQHGEMAGPGEYRRFTEPRVTDGKQPALVSVELWERVQGLRKGRDKAAGSDRVPKGRPNSNHLLAKLAVCARCGDPMVPITGTYRRKSDGGRARSYMCQHVKHGTGLCDAPSVDAELIEPEVIARLDRYFTDLSALIADAAAESSHTRTALERQVAAERAQVAELSRLEAKLADRYGEHIAAGEDTLANADATALARAQQRREQAEHRLSELLATLAAAQDEADPADRHLDWWNELSAELRGVLSRGRLQAVNEGLRDLFAEFELDSRGDGSVAIRPRLREPIEGQIGVYQPVPLRARERREPTPPAGLMTASAEERNACG